MYDYSDFPTDAGGYEPQPWIELVLLAAVVVLPILAFFLARALLVGRFEADRRKAVETIYDAIDVRARGAAAAVGPAILYGADLLVKEIKDRLGAVIALGGPLAKELKALEDAIKGPPPPPPPPPPPGGHKCTCVCTCADGKGGEGRAKAEDGQAQGQGQGQSQVSILTSGSVILTAPPTTATTPTTPTTGADNSHKLDQTQRVRLAVGAFTDYWSGHKAQRLKELSEAQKALLTPAPTVSKTPAKH
ncbi:hypothetical protein [Caulobacter sp. 17J80-11]|uniref:hypothetical protein n=1 Tax=Caulobacter sp. 17J80-11 TaxID=2763502 RepID=UPI00165384C6|nr:hypothetical protein [Caulobacter sp. 17J80-11]MBC6980387.1 hypothetical protein [Caulobacter sp. 17J80-11]